MAENFVLPGTASYDENFVFPKSIWCSFDHEQCDRRLSDGRHKGAMAEEADVRTLLEESKRLKSDLEAYEAAAFMQLRQSAYSDASIKRDYEAICESLESWMDNIIAEAKDDKVRKHHKHILSHSKGQRAFLRSVVPWDLDLTQVADKECSDYYFLSAITMSLLGAIFENKYPIGTPSHHRDFMTEFEEDMNSLSMGTLKYSVQNSCLGYVNTYVEGRSVINWRSDTLGTIVATS